MAVFLALAVGLLIGTAALDQTLVDQLEARTAQSEERLQEALARLEDTSGRLEGAEAFAEAVLPQLATGRLAGERVLLLAVDGADGTAVGEARQALEIAGAETVTQLWVTPRMAAETDEDRAELASILGELDSTSPSALAEQAALDLAGRIVEGAGRTEPDLLSELLGGGFVESRSPPIGEADLGRIGGRAQVVVVVGGPVEGAAVPPDVFLVPMALQLVTDGALVAAGDASGDGAAFVATLRERAPTLGEVQFVTVDDLDSAFGGVALVLALEDLVGAGRGGHYGTADGAIDGPVPGP